MVTEAMIESYALMLLVMSAFFVYFCGMVWAFCNPKIGGHAEETECDTSSFSQVSLQQIFADPEDVETTQPAHTHLTRAECLDQPTYSYIASSYIVD